MTERFSRAERRLRRRERRYETEQLMKEKRSEEMDVLEEVFDRTTLMIIYGMMNKGRIKKIFGAAKAGKESRLFSALDAKGKELAVKIYLVTSSEFRGGRLAYIEGDPRFRRTRRDTRSLVYLWAQKEFKNLQQARESGIRVPKPIHVEGNVLIMEFVGKDGISAPLLRETPLTNSKKTYDTLIEQMRVLYKKAGLVHGDLSEYNIMMLRGKPIIFDLAQGVSTSHPMADLFLRRDIRNINRYFESLRIKVKEDQELYNRITA